MALLRCIQIPIGVLIAVVAIGDSSSLLAGDQATDDAMIAIGGWKDWASQIVSGRYRAVGKVEYGSIDADLAGDVKIACAFDYSNGRYRFDRRQPFRAITIVDPPERNAKVSDSRGKNVIRQLRYSRTSEKSMHWSAGDLIDEDFVISIGPPDRLPLVEVQPLDVRIMGMVTFSEFKNCQPELGGKMIDLVEEFVKKNKVEQAQRHQGGLMEVWWKLHYDDRTRMIIWFDEKKSYVPVKTEFWNRSGDSKEFDTLLGRQESHWIEKGGGGGQYFLSRSWPSRDGEWINSTDTHFDLTGNR